MKQYATEDIVVLPVAVYIDAVPFSQTDSVLGFWLVNLIHAPKIALVFFAKAKLANVGAEAGVLFLYSSNTLFEF